MADSNPTHFDSRDPAPTAEADRTLERAVLAFLLDEHPDRLTIPEVSRAMNATEPADFGREDDIERAIRELFGAGLLHRECGFVLPTRAALYYWRLAM